MKLRNKKSKEIYETTMPIVFNIKTSGGGEHTVSCGSISELNEKWEDYEEPKKYWYITGEGYICRDDIKYSEGIEERKSIGNYFETEEEAEKAVEKLKAWKRLRDKGFRFCCDIKYESLCGNGFNIPLNAIMPPEAYTDIEVSKDLDLLFGGEE